LAQSHWLVFLLFFDRVVDVARPVDSYYFVLSRHITDIPALTCFGSRGIGTDGVAWFFLVCAGALLATESASL
jgi:hypothetical protein